MPGDPLERQRPKGISQSTWEHNRFEDVKREAWKREPLILLGTLIRNISAGHYKGKLGRTLVRAASEVYMVAGYHDSAPSEVPDDREEQLFENIEQVVSGNANDGLVAFANFLRTVGKAIAEEEKRARAFPRALLPGNDARIRNGLVIFLEVARLEQKAEWPTLDSLVANLSSGEQS